MTKRTQRSLIQAITSTYIWKNICRIEIFKFNFKPTLFKEVTRGNKWPTPKAEKCNDNLTLFKKKNYVNYNVHPRGCTDSNVRIIYQVKRFFKQINLIKWYLSGPVDLEKKKKVDLCGRVNRLPEFSWASQPWFPLKTCPQIYVKKRKVSLA